MAEKARGTAVPMLVPLLAGPRLVSAPFQLAQLPIPAVFPPPSLPIGRPCGPVTFSDISFGMCLSLMSWVQQVHNAAVVARSLGPGCHGQCDTDSEYSDHDCAMIP